jgi:Fe-S-cluster containining protein
MIARGFFAFDLGASRAIALARGERRYTLAGACQACARCCEAPAIQVSRLVWYLPTLRRGFLWWQRVVNGFELRSRDLAARAFVFECTHFDRATRRCDSYESRPGICRDYPRALLAQAAPEFFPGCGYRALAPGAARLAAALDGVPLSPEQRARLRQGLRLED